MEPSGRVVLWSTLRDRVGIGRKVGQEGSVAGIRDGPGQERCADGLGRKGGVPTLLHAPADVRLLLVSLRWTFLQMCRAAFRMGKVRTVVHKAHETSCQASTEGAGLPSASVDRRFFVRAYRQSSPHHWAQLSPGGQTTRCVVLGARTHPKPGQGMLGRGAGAGTFGSPVGHAPDAGVCDGPQDPADEEDGARYSVVRSTQPMVGVARKIVTFLRGGSVVDFGSAHGQDLYPKSILGHEPGWAARDRHGICNGINRCFRICCLVILSTWFYNTNRLLTKSTQVKPRSRPRTEPGEVRKSSTLLRSVRESDREPRYGSLTWGEGRNFPRFLPTLPCTSILRTWDTAGRWALVRRQGRRVCGRAAVCGRRRAESITLRELKAVPVAAEALRLLRREGGDQADSSARGQSVRRTHSQRDGRRIPPDDGRAAPVGGNVARHGRAVEARWLPSVVAPVESGGCLHHGGVIRSLSSAYTSDAVGFLYRPVGEHPVARRKFLETPMLEDWGDGRARLLNLLFDMLPLVLKKLEDDSARGVLVAPRWPAQPWYGRLLRLDTRVHVLGPGETAQGLTGRRALNPGWELVVADIGPSRPGALPSATRS